MRILPKTPSQQIEKLAAIVPTWQAHASQIGISEQQAADVAALLAAAQAVQLRALELREEAKAATLAFESAAEELAKKAAVTIRSIKAAAAAQGAAPDVLPLALLPVPAAPQRGRAAPTPENASVSLGSSGRAMITWLTGAGGDRGRRLGRQRKARSGLFYIIERTSIGPRGRSRPQGIGCTAEPRFIDERPLPGASVYHVWAVRGGRRSDQCAAASLETPMRAEVPASAASLRCAA